MTWPGGLKILTCRGRFDQSLQDVTWPHGLEILTFGDNYDQSLEKVIWPSARAFFFSSQYGFSGSKWCWTPRAMVNRDRVDKIPVGYCRFSCQLGGE